MRAPAVAGYFYNGDGDSLGRELRRMMLYASEHAVQSDAVCALCPHAGHQYSGDVAALTYASVRNITKAETIVIIGPNHRDEGKALALSMEDWATPLGIAKCDDALAKKILGNSRMVQADEKAHVHEHAIEVQVPFLQVWAPKAKIVCISMLDQGMDAAADLSNALAKALDPAKHTLIVSSDFSHYIHETNAEKNDKAALKYIEALDAHGFARAVEENDWSICGYGPITAGIMYSRKKGAKSGELIKYSNSGKKTGDVGSVVGYAGVVFRK
jgi:MEMO1 family protein